MTILGSQQVNPHVDIKVLIKLSFLVESIEVHNYSSTGLRDQTMIPALDFVEGPINHDVLVDFWKFTIVDKYTRVSK